MQSLDFVQRCSLLLSSLDFVHWSCPSKTSTGIVSVLIPCSLILHPLIFPNPSLLSFITFLSLAFQRLANFHLDVSGALSLQFLFMSKFITYITSKLHLPHIFIFHQSISILQYTSAYNILYIQSPSNSQSAIFTKKRSSI